MIITYGWYNENWWTGPATSSQYNCTAEDRATILPYTMGPVLPEFATDLDAEAEPGIVSVYQIECIKVHIVFVSPCVGGLKASHALYIV